MILLQQIINFMDPLQSQLSPYHKGLLREELVVLRRISDHDLGRGVRRFHHLTNLNLGEDLPGSFIKDLLIIAVDIGNFGAQGIEAAVKMCQLSRNGRFSIGLSILDARDLQNMNTEILLQTYNFCVGPSKHYVKASKKKVFLGKRNMLSSRS